MGPVLLAISLVVGTHFLNVSQALLLGVMLWMLWWWISEAVPVGITSLLPLVLLPFTGLLNLEQTCVAYGNRFVFLFLGGFILALAMEKTGLHKRLSLMIIMRTGSKPDHVILGFLFASFLISMWISNTATTMMMLPIAATSVKMILDKHVTKINERPDRFASAVMLSIAYGASIGGIATLIGSPPNAAMAGILEKSHGVEVTFMSWFVVGFPFALMLLVLTYVALVKWILPNRMKRAKEVHEVICFEYKELGLWRKDEVRVMILFVFAAISWIAQTWIVEGLSHLGLHWSDTSTAVLTGILLFLIPSGKGNSAIMSWKDTKELPWDILLMFGGGMALAQAFEQSGLAGILASLLRPNEGMSVYMFLVVLCGAGLLLTALISNIAMVNMFVPITGAIAVSMNLSPEYFAIPVTIAASCDFMFPMSTPPNAIAFSSGFVPARLMFKTGIWINLISWILLCAMLYFWI
jgi:sodium-dependent dicarboxylate transporter 2/3/5